MLLLCILQKCLLLRSKFIEKWICGTFFYSEVLLQRFPTKACRFNQNYLPIGFCYLACPLFESFSVFHHSHKKRKDCRETRAELAVLCIYVENQAILDPITGHQNVNKPNSRAARTVYGPIFLPFYKIIVSFFIFSVKM